MAEVKNATADEIKAAVKEYILHEFLPGANAEELTDATPLITGGILDSLATVQLVAFLEERYGVAIQPHEASVDYLNTLGDIAELVRAKQ
jgi:acyl carrier protein